jgi:hypothetical protein
MLSRRLAWALGLAFLLSGCATLREASQPDFDVLDYVWPTAAPVAWRTPQPSDYQLPRSPKPMLIVADRLPERPQAEVAYPSAMVALLRHFTADVRWVFADELTAKEVAAAQAVVYIGDNERFKIPSRAIQALRRARRLMWFGYHLDAVKRARLAFPEIEPTGRQVTVDGAGTLRYAGRTYPVDGHAGYVDVRVGKSAQVAARIRYGSTTLPLLLENRGNYYVSSVDVFDPNDSGSVNDVSLLAIADMLNDLVGAPSKQDAHTAMLFLNDVTAETAPRRLAAVVSLLYQKGIPYGIGFIPDERATAFPPGRVKESPYLLRVLLWAQQHGATIALRGTRKLETISADRKSEAGASIEDALKQQRSHGLDPIIWETPDASGGISAGIEAASIFGTAAEQGFPPVWVPWIVHGEAAGQLVLPAGLDRISAGGQPPIQQQLEWARTLSMCRGCVAVGVVRPTTVSNASIERYIDGLRSMGYVFLDPGMFARTRGRSADAPASPPPGRRTPMRLTDARAHSQTRTPRSRNALPMTETELNDMAAAAMMGERRMPNAG